jgi:soluble lytic murein transglycosylase-like protein
MPTIAVLLVLMAAGPPGNTPGPAAMEASVRRQRASVCKQIAAPVVPGAFFILPPPAPMPPSPTRLPFPEQDCAPLAEPDLQRMAEEAARSAGLQPQWLRAWIAQKSGGHSCAVSPSGAQGLMQLMPGILAQLSVADAFDPRQNLAAGARLLRQLLDRHAGDLDRAIAAYDNGAEIQAQPPDEALSPAADKNQ